MAFPMSGKVARENSSSFADPPDTSDVINCLPPAHVHPTRNEPAGGAPLDDAAYYKRLFEVQRGQTDTLRKFIDRKQREWLVESWSDRGKEIDRLQRIIQKLGKKNRRQHDALKRADEQLESLRDPLSSLTWYE